MQHFKRYFCKLKIPAEKIQDLAVSVLQKVLVPRGAFIKLYPFHALIAAQLIFIWFQIDLLEEIKHLTMESK